ncbi:MAG: CRISPR-associated exonuclease Cas4 [Thermacetogenium sp.]|nr:CRISPR-associated exonuclease Cas4 [Thermacetogenium sp.]
MAEQTPGYPGDSEQGESSRDQEEEEEVLLEAHSCPSFSCGRNQGMEEQSSLMAGRPVHVPPVVGSLVNAYVICRRKAWLMYRQISPDEDNVFLHMGRLIQGQSYGRERKEVRLEHLSLDLIRRDDENLIVAEVKKSSRARAAARMQLAFYLYELREMGIEAKGELLFPEERRRERMVLDESLAQQVEHLKESVLMLVLQEQAPPPERTSFCNKCAYTEFCWA